MAQNTLLIMLACVYSHVMLAHDQKSKPTHEEQDAASEQLSRNALIKDIADRFKTHFSESSEFLVSENAKGPQWSRNKTSVLRQSLRRVSSLRTLLSPRAASHSEPEKTKTPRVAETKPKEKKHRHKKHAEKKHRETSADDECKEHLSTSTAAEPQYDYINDEFINRVIAADVRYVLVGTGWSESSLGNMGITNQEKQKRAFALSLAQLLKIEQRGGKGRLIYLTTAPINIDYRRYLFRLANAHRYGDSEMDVRYRAFETDFLTVVYYSPKKRDRTAADPTDFLSRNANAYRQIKLPKALNELTSDYFASNLFVGFSAHFSGPHLETIAQQWKLPYLANPSSQAHWIKKSLSRQSFRDANVPHPLGTYEPSFTLEKLRDDIYELLGKITHKKVVVKLDSSAAGMGNKVIVFDDLTEDLSEQGAKDRILWRLQDKELFPDSYVKRLTSKDGGAIVEAYIDCEDYTSPATLYMISGLNRVDVRYTYEQLLGGLDNQMFQGSLGPYDSSQEGADIVEMSKKIGRYLSSFGVRGTVGTDFVICRDPSEGTRRVAYAIENNVRMTATSYPYYTLRTLIGDERIKRKHIKSFDDVRIPHITTKVFRERLQKEFYGHYLPHHPDTLNLKRGRGCLVHNDTFRLGKLSISCMDNSREEVIKRFDRFTKDIRLYLEDHEITWASIRMKAATEMENWKEGLAEIKTIVEKMLDKPLRRVKEVSTYYDRSGPIKISPAFADGGLQQEFFAAVERHEHYLNIEKGFGCLVNNTIFKSRKLGMVCVADPNNDIEIVYRAFYQDLRDFLQNPKGVKPSGESN